MNKLTNAYKACGTSKTDAPFMYGVHGPGNGLGYYAWYGHPENAFFTMEEAEKAARLMSLAYEEGKKARSAEIKELLE